MNNNDLFDILPEGFRLAAQEDLSLVNLTLAQAFADYKYPIPSLDVSYSALLRLYYELGSNCIKNDLENGYILTNDDFSAVLCLVPYELRTQYDIEALYKILKENDGEKAADNMVKIFDYICLEEEKIKIDKGTIFVDMFAVQPLKQGKKLGSKLMRELFFHCEKKNRNIFLYTNTERNKSIYKHFGYDVVSEVHKEEFNSDTYFLLWKSPKQKI